MTQRWLHHGGTRWMVRLLALVLLAAAANAVRPPSASANAPGSSFYTRASANEFLAYSRIIRLHHSGRANGTLIGTFEHATKDGTPSDFVIRTSKDDGKSWRTLTTVSDPLTGENHPSDQFWQPFLFELPKKMGKFPAGTLLLAGNMAPSEKVRTDFVLWRSTDHGEHWTFQSVLQSGGGSGGAPHGGSGVWEPFLAVDGKGRLAMYFSDERREPAHAQIIAHTVSDDGGVTWSADADGRTNFAPGLVVDVQSDSATDRPGMPTVATLPDGRMVMAYEICGDGRNCEAHTKTSTDGGTTWGSGPSDLGTMAVTSDGRYLGSSPYIVWSPAGGPHGQLMLTGMRTRHTGTNAFTPEDRQAVFTKDPDAKGRWSWTPAPFGPVADPSQNCSTSYSPDLLLGDGGRTFRYTTATSAGPTGCMEATGVANSGVLPYASDFGNGAAGWIDYGGCWTASDGVLSETCGGDGGNKSIAGSTGWSDYRLAGDVRIDSGAQAGFVLRASDPGKGTDALNGYYVGVSAGSIVLGRQDGTWRELDRAAVPGGLATGAWYHLAVRAVGCGITVTGSPAGHPASRTRFTYKDPDCSFTSGAIGVRDQSGTASWRHITVTPAGGHAGGHAPAAG
ncbi:exo-alpha-sialidase [Streptomyces montanisoli]|uniref:Exo-alpha-sialidase n=1 Tax=Streptomyces montanisoli TaxID=2798581 RepID=A0A940MM76_9ACTN|nr:exo-alpha-sialidase [Streptomyces montanisoli]MBP0460983.1 exo-alpha-sialidase [Streptomyces montanisoli]